MIGLICFIVDIAVLPLWGWSLSANWGWFAVPVFGVPGFDWKQGIGISLLLGLIQYKTWGRARTDYEQIYATFEGVVAPLVMLVVGSVVAHVMGVA
jgi:hypothetical protein